MQRPRLILISAMTGERVIGSRNGLPWSIPDEYRHFLDHVRGQVVLMGRVSYEIFGPDLTESELIVVSASAHSLPGAEVFADLDGALERARTFGKTVFSAGGASIYRLTLPLADAMYLSFVKGSYRGDRYFPRWDEQEWTVTRRVDHPQFEFRVYERAPGGE